MMCVCVCVCVCVCRRVTGGLLPNMGVVGGYSDEYLNEIPEQERQHIDRARDIGTAVTTNVSMLCKSVPWASPMRPLPRNATLAALHRLSSIFVTMYDPGTYEVRALNWRFG
jgi:hypothetical protein